MKKLILTALFLFFGIISFAQIIKFDSVNLERQHAALPYYSYGKGLGLTSPDSIFQLNIRFRMQNRATFNHFEDGEESIDAQVRRLRLRFDGYVGSPDFMYSIQLSFAPEDVGELEEGKNINIIRDAVIVYKPNDHWDFSFDKPNYPETDNA